MQTTNDYIKVLRSHIAEYKGNGLTPNFPFTPSLLNLPTKQEISLDEIRQLEAIILQFAEDESIGRDNKFPTCLNPYIDTLVQYLLQSEFIELSCSIQE